MNTIPTPPNFSRRLADVLADGFADDPVMNWTFGSPKPQKFIFQTLANHLYLQKGRGALLPVGGQDAAACLWLHAEANKQLPLVPTLKIAGSILRHGGPASALRTLKLDTRLEKKHPDFPHVYLFAVAVRDGFQGKGLGGKVLAPMLQHCDEQDLPAYLENSKGRNLPFYRKLGFEVLEQFEPGGSCSPLWLMLRQPKR